MPHRSYSEWSETLNREVAIEYVEEWEAWSAVGTNGPNGPYDTAKAALDALEETEGVDPETVAKLRYRASRRDVD